MNLYLKEGLYTLWKGLSRKKKDIYSFQNRASPTVKVLYSVKTLKISKRFFY